MDIGKLEINEFYVALFYLLCYLVLDFLEKKYNYSIISGRKIKNI